MVRERMALQRNYNVVLRAAAQKYFPWLAVSQEQELTCAGSCSRCISSSSALKITAKSFPKGKEDPKMKGCDAASFWSCDVLNSG